jgi:hypothetical protein
MFGDDVGVPFYLVTSPSLESFFEIVCERHTGGHIVTLAPQDAVGDVLTRLPEPAHVLVVAPESFVNSLPTEVIGRRKLAVVASNSTPCPPEAVAHFITAIENTSAAEQKAWSERFFASLNAAGMAA